MSQLEVLTTTAPINFDRQFTDRIITEGDFSTSPQSYRSNGFTLSQSPYNTFHDFHGKDDNQQLDDNLYLPNLPPLRRGHPAVHLRDGVINSHRLSADDEPDSEKAFFVADLSYVYNQHERWKRCLPQIEPFYGMDLTR